MMWKVRLLASHSVTASTSRGKTGLSVSLDIKISTMSSNKGNCTKIRLQQQVDEYWPIKLPSRDDYPTPRHGENVGQLPFLDDFRHVAEINVLLTADGQV
jgi:hypothetical protein